MISIKLKASEKSVSINFIKKEKNCFALDHNILYKTIKSVFKSGKIYTNKLVNINKNIDLDIRRNEKYCDVVLIFTILSRYHDRTHTYTFDDRIHIHRFETSGLVLKKDLIKDLKVINKRLKDVYIGLQS